MLTAYDLSNYDPDTIKDAISALSSQEVNQLVNSWKFWARPEQLPPEGDWTNWLYLAGRGAGKTRSGAEYIKDIALKYPGIRISLIAPTVADVRDTMIHGVSGLLSIHWQNGTRPRHVPSHHAVVWPNGSLGLTYSSEEPERLRGPNFHVAWCDELAAWRYLEQTWDMLQFGLRLEYPGFSTPRTYISTTPRPVALIRSLVDKSMLASGTTVITRGTTFDNRANLSKKYFERVISRYENSTLGRQEIYGELIEDLSGALWKRSLIHHVDKLPKTLKTVIAVDPAASDKVTANECGIIAASKCADSRVYVHGDFTTHAQSPAVWGKKAIDAYYQLKANYIIAEANLAGGLVKTVLKQIDPNVPVKFLMAKKGKYLRAEPVAMLYEQSRVSHVGHFPKLEDQMCRFTATFEKENPGQSPDRVDALVYAVGNLLLESTYDSSMSWI